MDRDYAFRFTNEIYATKDDVKKVLNVNSIDLIWESIINYRRLYYKMLDVFSLERKPFVICYAQGLMDKIIKVERKINNLYLKKVMTNYSSRLNHINILKTLCEFNNLNETSINLIEALVDESITNFPRQYSIIHNYDVCLKDIDKCYASPFNEQTIKRLYSILVHGEVINIDNMQDIYRQNDLNDYFESKGNYAYISCPHDKIPLYMDNLFDLVSVESGFSLVKCALIFFFIMYYKPFECFNEEMAILLSKYFYKHEGLEMNYMPLENLLLEIKALEFDKTFNECENELDVTYFVDKYLQYLDKVLTLEEKKITSLQNENIKNEVLIDDDHFNILETQEIVKDTKEEIKEEKKEAILVPNTSSFEGVVFERKVSMPVLPKGLDEKDASLVASNLLEICPTLKKGQAEFYARHCTIGKYYTIQQYKEERQVAYETARTSMDNLCYLGFYKKEKIRNKFVYTPVIRD